MKRLVVALLMAVGLLVVPATTAPAQADLFGGSIQHAQDAGYDRAIKVEFDNVLRVRVPEGSHSDWFEPNGSEDVNRIWVDKGMEIWRLRGERTGGAHYVKWFDRRGWHKIDNLMNAVVVVHAD
jgi:hypothetical protein